MTPEEKVIKAEKIRRLTKSLKEEQENKNPDNEYVTFLKLELEKLK